MFYPAITLYHGQLAAVYGKSSASVFPSVFVTGRILGDPANSLETPAIVKTGTTDDLSTRYGDYFGAGTDPVPTANSTFWVSGEYRAHSANSNWNTVIAQVGSFAPDFAISAKPSNITIVAGSTGNSTITVTGYKFTGSVNLTPSIVPTGLSCTLNPDTVVLGTSAAPTLTCSGSEGSYNVTVTGTSGSISHSVSILATVQPSSSVGGSLVPVNMLEILLPYVALGLSALMIFLLGAMMSRQSRAKIASPSSFSIC